MDTPWASATSAKDRLGKESLTINKGSLQLAPIFVRISVQSFPSQRVCFKTKFQSFFM